MITDFRITIIRHRPFGGNGGWMMRDDFEVCAYFRYRGHDRYFAMTFAPNDLNMKIFAQMCHNDIRQVGLTDGD